MNPPFDWQQLEQQQELALASDCRRCFGENGGVMNVRMFLCTTCGNKRCPKATDHRNDCTDSNEAGQKGSDY